MSRAVTITRQRLIDALAEALKAQAAAPGPSPYFSRLEGRNDVILDGAFDLAAVVEATLPLIAVEATQSPKAWLVRAENGNVRLWTYGPDGTRAMRSAARRGSSATALYDHPAQPSTVTAEVADAVHVMEKSLAEAKGKISVEVWTHDLRVILKALYTPPAPSPVTGALVEALKKLADDLDVEAACERSRGKSTGASSLGAAAALTGHIFAAIAMESAAKRIRAAIAAQNAEG